jgi:hypothetical protein
MTVEFGAILRDARIARSSVPDWKCSPHFQALSNSLKMIRFSRHGRACPGHPCLSSLSEAKTWMPGTSPGMTNSSREPYFIACILIQTLRMKLGGCGAAVTVLRRSKKSFACPLAISGCFLYDRAPSLGHGFGLSEIPTGASRSPVSCSAE